MSAHVSRKIGLADLAVNGGHASLSRRLGLAAPRQRFSFSYRNLSNGSDHFWLTNLADAIDLLATTLRAGLPLVDALKWVQQRAAGLTEVALSAILLAVDSGDSTATALLAFEASQKDPHLRELAMKLALAEQLGSPVAGQLGSLSKALRLAQLTQTRELASKKENRIMLPVVFLALPVTVLFAVFPSIQFLQFQNI